MPRNVLACSWTTSVKCTLVWSMRWSWTWISCKSWLEMRWKSWNQIRDPSCWYPPHCITIKKQHQSTMNNAPYTKQGHPAEGKSMKNDSYLRVFGHLRVHCMVCWCCWHTGSMVLHQLWDGSQIHGDLRAHLKASPRKSKLWVSCRLLLLISMSNSSGPLNGSQIEKIVNMMCWFHLCWLDIQRLISSYSSSFLQFI